MCGGLEKIRPPALLFVTDLPLTSAVARGGAAALALASTGLATNTPGIRHVCASACCLCTSTLILVLLGIVHDSSPIFLRAQLHAR
jgi:hypothetical protein